MSSTMPGRMAAHASATCSGVDSVSTSFCTARVPCVFSAAATSTGRPARRWASASDGSPPSPPSES